MDWTREEVILIVNDYFNMFKMELTGIPYNKTEHRKKLIPLLNNRPKAVEFKHQNISGALASMGFPYIRGYKPLFSYQQLLKDEVILYLEKDKFFFEKEFRKFSDEKIIPLNKKIHFENIIDNKSTVKPKKIKESEPSFRPIKINFLKREQDNRQLGEKGESLVFDYEKWRLIELGKASLADKIEWVSKEKGDGMGFDILSKNDNGTDRFIEVKTTKLAKETPIYFSKNEMKFAALKKDNFFLYRVFNFENNPQISIKNGNYESFCQIKALSFKGYFL